MRGTATSSSPSPCCVDSTACLSPPPTTWSRPTSRSTYAGIVNRDAALRQAAGQDFYNTSGFTLRDLRSVSSAARLRLDFEAYLDGFSPNVQEVLDNFEFRNQIPRLTKADALGSLIEKRLDPSLDLSPHGLDNHGMGTVFEELVRRFNEENNEEAGEHWDAMRRCPPDDPKPVRADRRPDSSQAATSPTTAPWAPAACSPLLKRHSSNSPQHRGHKVKTYLFGQEINAETYAIAKADLILKGEGEAADNVVGGPEWSTLSNDAFAGREFDFMLSNPPYGKSWKTDQERMGGAKNIRDPRFVVGHAGDPEYSLVTRSSDGQSDVPRQHHLQDEAQHRPGKPHR